MERPLKQVQSEGSEEAQNHQMAPCRALWVCVLVDVQTEG